MTHQQILMSVVGFGVFLLVLGVIYDDQPKPGPIPLSERCSELGGEWLYKSADLLCLLPDGGKLSYNSATDQFVRYEKENGVIAIAHASSEGGATAHACSRLPKFQDYSVEEKFDGQPQIDFSTNRAALRYRTAITRDLARGANFAGKYIASTWGCGSSCQGLAVVNAETGRILSYGITSSGFFFEEGSRLLTTVEGGAYVVQDDELVKICQ